MLKHDFIIKFTNWGHVISKYHVKYITSKTDLRQGDLNNPVAMSRGFTFGVCLNQITLA